MQIMTNNFFRLNEVLPVSGSDEILREAFYSIESKQFHLTVPTTNGSSNHVSRCSLKIFIFSVSYNLPILLKRIIQGY